MGIPPKWMVYFMEYSHLEMDDLGVNYPYFRKPPCCFIGSENPKLIRWSVSAQATRHRCPLIHYYSPNLLKIVCLKIGYPRILQVSNIISLNIIFRMLLVFGEKKNRLNWTTMQAIVRQGFEGTESLGGKSSGNLWDWEPPVGGSSQGKSMGNPLNHQWFMSWC